MDDHWYPKDSRAQARVDEYLEWQHANTRLSCAMYFQHKVCQQINVTVKCKFNVCLSFFQYVGCCVCKVMQKFIFQQWLLTVSIQKAYTLHSPTLNFVVLPPFMLSIRKIQSNQSMFIPLLCENMGGLLLWLM